MPLQVGCSSVAWFRRSRRAAKSGTGRRQESAWCSDLSELRKFVAKDGGFVSIEKALAVREVPLRKIARSEQSERREATVARAKARKLERNGAIEVDFSPCCPETHARRILPRSAVTGQAGNLLPGQAFCLSPRCSPCPGAQGQGPHAAGTGGVLPNHSPQHYLGLVSAACSPQMRQLRATP
jgi:hypothetical protein